MRQELTGIEGVVEAEVSYDAKLAQVRYVADQVTPEQMVEAIVTTGFGASLIEANSGDE